MPNAQRARMLESSSRSYLIKFHLVKTRQNRLYGMLTSHQAEQTRAEQSRAEQSRVVLARMTVKGQRVEIEKRGKRRRRDVKKREEEK
jgi:hypothetical protein